MESPYSSRKRHVHVTDMSVTGFTKFDRDGFTNLRSAEQGKLLETKLFNLEELGQFVQKRLSVQQNWCVAYAGGLGRTGQF